LRGEEGRGCQSDHERGGLSHIGYQNNAWMAISSYRDISLSGGDMTSTIRPVNWVGLQAVGTQDTESRCHLEKSMPSACWLAKGISHDSLLPHAVAA
jgi:hypothetical protein